MLQKAQQADIGAEM